MKTTWADVSVGDLIELDGKAWLVLKAKRKGKAVKVGVRRAVGARGTFESEVRAKDRVKMLDKGLGDPLHEPRGMKAQRRWAEPEEAAAKGLGPGDPSLTKPPAKAKGDPWETQGDRVEKMLDKMLGAHLVAESKDEAAGYYVPPVDITTVASHLALFHPNDYDAEKDEATMLVGHEHAHRMAREGRKPLDVNHWHTKVRP